MHVLATSANQFIPPSLGVLQHDDVRFEPPLPVWKREAIYSMTMVCQSITTIVPALTSIDFQGVYTKIFLQFPYKFWFDTEVRLV